MSLAFLTTPFEDDAHLIFDNDGVQSEIVVESEEAQPNLKLVGHIEEFLQGSALGKYSTLSGRLTKFLHSRKPFDDLISNYPNQTALYGFYGNQSSRFGHLNVSPPVLVQYEQLLRTVIADVEESMQDIFDATNILIIDPDKRLSRQELCDLILEDKDFALGLHQRRLIAYVNAANALYGLMDKRTLERFNGFFQELADKVLAITNEANPKFQYKLKYGKLVTEFFPDHLEVADDKVVRFQKLYDEHVLAGDCSAIYYFGDDLGDYGVFDFILKNRLNPEGPKTYFIFVDSSTLDDVYDADLARMNHHADFVVTPAPGLSAVENLTEIVGHKVGLGLSKQIDLGW